MIAFLKGIMYFKNNNNVVIEVNGIGYLVQVPASDILKLPGTGCEVFIHTYHYVREDQAVLFGFLKPEDKEVFELLLEVSGVGPKVALSILSSLPAHSLVQAIAAENLAALTQLPGVGKKTAQRIILELKDKVQNKVLNNYSPQDNYESKITFNSYADALTALLSLGYSQREVEPILKRAINNKEQISSQDLVKKALQELGKL